MDDAKRDALRRELGRLHPVITPRGTPMMIVRPEKPSVALTVAKAALELQDVGLLAKLPEGAGEYIFVGYLAKAPKKYKNMALAIDAAGDIVDEAQPGDSFIAGENTT